VAGGNYRAAGSYVALIRGVPLFTATHVAPTYWTDFSDDERCTYAPLRALSDTLPSHPGLPPPKARVRALTCAHFTRSLPLLILKLLRGALPLHRDCA